MYEIHQAHWTELNPHTAYNLIRLRTRVFVMEQGVVSVEELDGRDLEPSTKIWWAEIAGKPVATLRVLHEGPGLISIGRVATDQNHRGQGVASSLLKSALDQHRNEVVEVHAQIHLQQWYEGFGLVRRGDSYDEAGIEHVTMTRGPLT